MDREGGGTGKGKEGMSVRRRDRKERGRGGHKREPLISRLLSSISRKVLLWQGGECLSMLMGSMERWNSWTGFFPESHRAKETSCFDPFIVDATFSARTGRCLGFWKNGESDRNGFEWFYFSMILFSFFFFMVDLSFINFFKLSFIKNSYLLYYSR